MSKSITYFNKSFSQNNVENSYTQENGKQNWNNYDLKQSNQAF